MPFVNEKQRRYMWANHPEIARKWQEEAGDKQGLKEAADRYTMKMRPRTIGDVPDAPKVAMRQNSGIIPPRLHKRQPQKGRPRGQ
jgi:hypothetical protein